MQVRSCLVLAVTAALAASPARADPRARDAALKRLQAAAKGTAAVSAHKATDVARFVQLPPGARGLGQPAARTDRDKQSQSAAFFRSYGAAIGVSDPAGLRHVATITDALGETHLTYRQFHGAVPVFGGTVKVHFDAAHRLKAVNGTAIPDLALSTTPAWSGARAAEVALGAVIRERGASDALGIGTSTLYVYREGLARGVPGDAQLAWEIEVTDGAGVRELVYVSAQTGKVLERISGIHDELRRRAYDGHDLAFAPNNYPNGVYWLEGQRYPTASEEANNMITSLEGDLRLLRERLRPRLLRRRGRHDGRHLRPRLRLPERLVERHVHLVLPGHHHRRRHRARVGARVHAVHARSHLRVAARRAQRGVLGHLGRDRRSHQRARRRRPGQPPQRGSVLDPLACPSRSS